MNTFDTPDQGRRENLRLFVTGFVEEEMRRANSEEGKCSQNSKNGTQVSAIRINRSNAPLQT